MVNFFKFLFEAFKEWVRDKSASMAAALAFYQLLSVGPLTGFIIVISGKILGTSSVQEDVMPLLKNWLSPQLIKVIAAFLEEDEGVKKGELSTLSILSGLALAYGAKEYFGQIKQTTENVWGDWHDKFGIKELLKRNIKDLKVASIAIGIITFFVLIRALLPHPYITADTDYFSPKNLSSYLMQSIAGFVFIFSLMIFFFVYLPPVKVLLKNAVPGAVLTSVLFIIGREIMRIQMQSSPDAGMAESFIVVILWFYYANLVFVYGAEFNKVYIARKQNIDVGSLKF